MLRDQASTRVMLSKSLPDDEAVEEEEEEKEDHHLDSSLVELNPLELEMSHVQECTRIQKNEESPGMGVHNTLKKEILQLERRLKDQFEVRLGLEKALALPSFLHDSTKQTSMPKPATEMIREIAVLEVEVVHLEQYLLSLYRKAFNGQFVPSSSLSPSTKHEKVLRKSPLSDIASKSEEEEEDDDSTVQSSSNNTPCRKNPKKEPIDVLDSRVHRCHSSVVQHSGFETKASHKMRCSNKTALRPCHSQPSSMVEHKENNASSNIISLAEHLGTRISDHVPETPNHLSEQMIRCMSEIYSKLADPPSTNPGLLSSSFSRRAQCDTWSPGFRNNSSFDVQLDNPLLIEGLKEFSGPYSTILEISLIYRNNQKLGEIEHLFENFKSLIARLQEVDPRKMKHEEKLAFWINIHNALVMHAYMAYEIPQNNVKRVFLLLRAAYNIGGQTISVDTIQSCILGCKTARPGQWLRLLLSLRTKLKTGDERQAYSINQPEPLLHFALCSGNHSDPVVRIYTAKGVLQELETAKNEHIRATFGVRKEGKVVVPKVVESFAKDSGFCGAGLIEMIQTCLPESSRKNMKRCRNGNLRKNIEFVPHNFTFRFLISKELVN